MRIFFVAPQIILTAQVWARSHGAPISAPLSAAIWTSLMFVGLALTGCLIFAFILYRRARAPRLPHHDLIEELNLMELDESLH